LRKGGETVVRGKSLLKVREKDKGVEMGRWARSEGDYLQLGERKSGEGGRSLSREGGRKVPEKWTKSRDGIVMSVSSDRLRYS